MTPPDAAPETSHAAATPPGGSAEQPTVSSVAGADPGPGAATPAVGGTPPAGDEPAPPGPLPADTRPFIVETDEEGAGSTYVGVNPADVSRVVPEAGGEVASEPDPAIPGVTRVVLTGSPVKGGAAVVYVSSPSFAR